MNSKAYQYCVKCISCGYLTSKTYARTHEGSCKQCATGNLTRRLDKATLCPDCGVHELTVYQIRHHYHCDACTRAADPMGMENSFTYDGEPSYDAY